MWRSVCRRRRIRSPARPRDVIEDVHRLGGFGIAAHPGSPRPSLQLARLGRADRRPRVDQRRQRMARRAAPADRARVADVSVPGAGIDGDAARSAGRRAAAMGSSSRATRRVLGLAGADAHARLGFRQRTDPDVSPFHVPLPGYESSFRAFSNHVVLDAPLTGDAAADAARLLDAIRNGRVFTRHRRAGLAGQPVVHGDQRRAVRARWASDLAIDGDVLLRASASAPPGTTLVLLRNGQRVHEVTDGALETNGGREPAAYRIEAYTAGAPGRPAGAVDRVEPDLRRPASGGAVPTRSRRRRRAFRRAPSEAAAESGANDIERRQRQLERRCACAHVRRRSRRSVWRFALAPGTPAGQFAAVAVPDRRRSRRVRSRAVHACRRRRRCARGCSCARRSAATERWGTTFYADAEPRIVDFAVARVPADRRDVERAAAARSRRLAAVRGGYAEHAAGHERAADDLARSGS